MSGYEYSINELYEWVVHVINDELQYIAKSITNNEL